jgi:hypothetical protein
LFLIEPFDFIKVTEELSTFNKLHQEIDTKLILENIVHVDDKRMINRI